MKTDRAPIKAPEVAAEKLQRLVDRLASKQRFGHAVMGVERGDGSFSWRGAAGVANLEGAPMTPETPFFLASVTKLYIATIVLQLHEEGRVDLDLPMSTYLGNERVAGLHRVGAVDHTPEITTFHLLSHTSGLNDYMEGKPDGEKSLYQQIVEGNDLSWSFDDVLRISRDRLHPHFPPRAPTSGRRKGRYSDTGFQLLIAIIEESTGASFASVLEQRIIRPLELRQTWLPGNSEPLDPVAVKTDIWSNNRPLAIPNAMASFNDLYASVEDALRFLAALTRGELFRGAPTYRLMAERRNRVIWPVIYYGLGMMNFKIGRLNAPGLRPLTLVGHTGASGSWLFHCPELDVFTAGTVDEVKARAFPFRFIPKVLRTIFR